jgi:hypothetical protein
MTDPAAPPSEIPPAQAPDEIPAQNPQPGGPPDDRPRDRRNASAPADPAGPSSNRSIP